MENTQEEKQKQNLFTQRKKKTAEQDQEIDVFSQLQKDAFVSRRCLNLPCLFDNNLEKIICDESHN